jgi:putative pyruvate formate lyase activating enzyme
MFEKAYEECRLCPRECGVNRKEGQTGFCQMDGTLRVARAALHMWEEPCISGKRGSGAVFFSGCNLRCVYCQNFDIAAGTRGKEISRERLSEIFLELQAQGAANINLVTPDHDLPDIVWALLKAKEQGLCIPVVYNGSGYEKADVIAALEGLVDIFLTDFKYMDGELAGRLSHAGDYPEVAKRALEQMVKITGAHLFNEEGMMQRGVIVRHLLLPGHKKNAKAVLRYLWETYGDRVYISLMNQYTPMVQLTSHSVIRRNWKRPHGRSRSLCAR